MTDPHPSSWQLETNTWEQLCEELNPATSVDRPYKRVRVGYYEDTDHLGAYVEEPYPELEDVPELDSDEENDQLWDDRPSNDITQLSPELTEQIWDVLNSLRDTGLSVTTDEITVDLRTSLFTPTGSTGVFYMTRALGADEARLYTKFRELMVTLGHADDPADVTHGYELAPTKDDLSDHEWDIGMGATAYRKVDDPHTYWANCETLDDYIDMCVENGADREELEARDWFSHHFHPDTRIAELTSEQQAAVAEWRDALQELFIPHVQFEDTVLRHGVSRADFNEDGTGKIAYSVTVGDDLFDKTDK